MGEQRRKKLAKESGVEVNDLVGWKQRQKELNKLAKEARQGKVLEVSKKQKKILKDAL